MENNRISGGNGVQQVGATSLAEISQPTGPDVSVSPSEVIAAAVANLDEQRRADRSASRALRSAAHQETSRRVHQMRKAANSSFVGALAGAALKSGAALVGIGQEANSGMAALSTTLDVSGDAIKGGFDRAAALDNTQAELARDRAQSASELSSDAASDAEQAQRRSDQALGHMGEIQQQLNRGREAAIRG
ncbi:MAG: hypothetical protein GXP55_15715 [Deltaproteobacteria bacterium]|nr:hypothetical protein [Deltaproteobacteria bacterium]